MKQEGVHSGSGGVMAQGSDSTHFFSAPFVAPEIAPVGGVIKQRDEDFLVEEIPLYTPCGEGEHIYLFVEKRGMSTTEMVDVIARHFGVDDYAVGYAGMKDKYALTRQVVSVHTPGKRPEDFPSLRHEGIGILWTDLHTNKLRLGHLKGNRFSIRIREVDPLRVVDVHRCVRLLSERGVPNLFGAQRFGYRLNNHVLGQHLLRREFGRLLDGYLGVERAGMEQRREDGNEEAAESRRHYDAGDIARAAETMPAHMRNERDALRALRRGASPEEAVRSIHPVQIRFWISAFQSAMFNQLVSERMADGLLQRLVPGDIAMKMSNGAMFDVDQETLADPMTAQRLSRFEIAPTAPLWGPRTKPAQGEIGRREQHVLARAGTNVHAIEGTSDEFGVSVLGTRRAARIPLVDPEVEGGVDEHGAFIRIAFELPSGSFATAVLREVMKNHASAGHMAGSVRDAEGEHE